MMAIMEAQTSLLRTLAEGRKHGSDSVESVPITVVNPVNLQVLPTERVSKKLQSALDWFTEHPEMLDAKSRDIAQLIGVSHMTVYKAQQILRGETARGKRDNESEDTSP